MLFIRSFSAQIKQTEQLASWIEEVCVALENVSPLRLRFVVHEAFVNACKFSEDENSSIIVLIRQKDRLEITVTDPGRGFILPEEISKFDHAAIGFKWNLVRDRDTSVVAELSDSNTLRFMLQEEQNVAPEELKENHRGLISILKASKNLSYHYVPNSFNYLHITC
ncbi:MAG: ATP-binding protein [Bacteroidota bacterium]|nr:ATP-binding protein [Bacteroidota bacterium]MDX5431186.1 ATP-binding protein [Bacteroidota bacterium]MDX5469925.1 ATP-binding protein [Bacteroidota bacterium]